MNDLHAAVLTALDAEQQELDEIMRRRPWLVGPAKRSPSPAVSAKREQALITMRREIVELHSDPTHVCSWTADPATGFKTCDTLLAVARATLPPNHPALIS